jgi:hypothetical protein
MGAAEGAIVPSSVIMMPGPGSVSVASPLERGGGGITRQIETASNHRGKASPGKEKQAPRRKASRGTTSRMAKQT